MVVKRNKFLFMVSVVSKSVKLYLFVFIVTFLFNCSHTTDINGKQNISASIEYIEDETRLLNIQDVLILESKHWRVNEESSLRFSFSKSVYWLKINLNKFDQFSEMQNRRLIFKWKALDSAELYYLNNKGVIKKQIAGDAYPKLTWTLRETHFPAFLINVDKNCKNIYYVRIHSTSILNFPVFIESETSWLRDLARERAIIFIYSAILLALVLFAFFLYLSTHDINYLLYAGYILFLGLAFDTVFGNAFDLFWPEATWWQSHAPVAFIGMQAGFALLFIRRLLDFARLVPQADLGFKILAVSCFVSLPFGLFDIYGPVFRIFLSTVYMFSIPTFFIIGISLLSKSRPFIRLFIASWGIKFFFTTFHILFVRNVLPYHNFYVYGIILVLPIDIIFLLMSVREKQKQQTKEHTRLLDEKIRQMDEVFQKNGRPKYHKSSISEINMDDVMKRLNILMEKEKIYLIEDLRLSDLAKAINLNRTQVSEILNSKFQLNFTKFVNQYRIEEAKRQLLALPDMTILEVAFSTGFGSKTVFTTEFKRITGMSAREYRSTSVQK